MIIITDDYSIINKPKMTSNFIIRLSDLKKIYDINEGEIGILFKRSFSLNECQIQVKGKDKNLLAKDILKMLLEDEKIFNITGDISLK